VGSPGGGLLIYGLGTWGFLTIFSLTVRSVYVDRIFLPAMGGLLLLGAILIASAPAEQRGVARVLLGLMGLSASFSLGLSFRYERKQEIRSAAQYIFRHAVAGDAVACMTAPLQPAAEYYLRDGDCPLLPDAICGALTPAAALGNLGPEAQAAALGNLRSLW